MNDGAPAERVMLPVTQLPHAAGLALPSYATAHAAGLDLMAAVTDPILLRPGERALIPTGLALAIPVGFEGQVRPRSGLALKHGLTLPNSPGTIDADYRGEVKVILANGGSEDFTVTRGMRIAQLVIARHAVAQLQPVPTLPVTVRGGHGFGSTGV